MSGMTTDSSRTATAVQQSYLDDYTIRLVGHEQLDQASPPSREDARPRAVENPPGWYDQHRHVPPYRPINRNLDSESRPVGANPVIALIVGHLFAGVWVQSVSSFFSFLSFLSERTDEMCDRLLRGCGGRQPGGGMIRFSGIRSGARFEALPIEMLSSGCRRESIHVHNMYLLPMYGVQYTRFCDSAVVLEHWG